MKAALLVLIAALHSVESDCGLTSANELQITRLVVIDAIKAAKLAGVSREELEKTFTLLLNMQE